MIEQTLSKHGFCASRITGFLVCVGLFFITFALFFKGIGNYPFWDPWEPKYAKAISEMLTRHDFITPYLNDEIRWTKPILIYWLMLLSSFISGITEYSIRLPSALSATFGVFVVYYLLLRLRNKATARVGACALATLPQYFYLARQAMPDMLMTALLTAAMAAFAIARFKTGQERYFYVFYAFLALAFLAKGPVVGAITLLALCLFGLVDLDWSQFKHIHKALPEIMRLWRYYRLSAGVCVFAVIAAPWYIAMLAKHGQAFIDNFLMYENITRFKEPIRSHQGLITYYVQNLFHGMYPWSSFLPAAFLFLFYGQTGLTEEVKQRWYFVSWFLAVFILFSFAGTKQQHYILPITPFVAILTALVFEEYLNAKPAFWMQPALLLSALMVWLTIRDFLISGDGYLFDVFTLRLSIDTGNDIDSFLQWFLYAWLAWVMLALLWRRARFVLTGVAIVLAFLNGLYFTQVVMPTHSEKRTLKFYIDRYRQQADTTVSDLVFYSAREQASMYYYYDYKRYQHIRPGQRKKILRQIKRNPETWFIAEKRFWRRLSGFLYRYTGKRWRRVAYSHAMYVLLKPESR